MKHLQTLLAVLVMASFSLWAQSPTATIDGRVSDPSKAVIGSATVDAVNIDTNLKYSTVTNTAGLFRIVNLSPGTYRIVVSKTGFRTIVNPGVVLHVQDMLALNFELPVGSITESVTVSGGAPLVRTEDASVGTVVDRNFAENLPMNGRSFQTLIQLTPGVVPATGDIGDGGQFSINGQRANANYWMVDGVSANVGLAASGVTGNGLSGSLGTFSALGGTNSLVSVDALQEFRIQTSTYAPEFGRTPGGQISIVTRSGTNQFHGTVFDYLRNDVLDANNWFADNTGQPKPQERQNDFGGTLGGPFLKNKTFFFFSYEGLRLRLPQTLLTTVPDLAARSSASPALQPFFNAYPQPNGLDDTAAGTAQFNSSFSNPASLDAYSLRIDHKVREKLNVFGRYSYSPSFVDQRAAGGAQALSVLFPSRIKTQTATIGGVLVLSPTISNDMRLNYSRTDSFNGFGLDNFGGAAPVDNPPFPKPFSLQNSSFFFDIASLRHGGYETGKTAENAQRQFNIVDNIALQAGSHIIKFGVDYRRLTPHYNPTIYSQAVLFLDVAAAQKGNVFVALFGSNAPAFLKFQNLGAFAQDRWTLGSRLVLTYGFRWDVDFAPSGVHGPSIPSVTGFNLNDLSRLALAPAGVPPFRTTYGNVAPRLGLSYRLLGSPDYETILRGGFGLFYDMATGETGNLLGQTSYPFGAGNFVFGGAFPFDAATAAPPPIALSELSNAGSSPLTAFDPNLKLPYTLQWNVALGQALGQQQSLSASYIGSVGRRLLQTAVVSSPNPSFNSAYLVANTATSDYDAFQIQFERQMSRGLQALASYAWAHSLDTASAGSNLVGSNTFVPGGAAGSNRGPSDFDIRHVLSAATTYEIPTPRLNSLVDRALSGWSIQNIFQVHSAAPVNVFDANLPQFVRFSTQVRPDRVPGQPLYLFGSQFPGRKALNPAAFISPPLDANGNATRQGNLGRNALRGFGLTQWDFSIHRDFVIHEALKLQFRAEMFNLLNHPNFAPPESGLGNGGFGQSNQILSESLGSNVGAGAFNALYQIGGPRSIQFALKLLF